MMTQDFAGRSAIVSGAGSGIGAAIARELAERGAGVLLADIELSAAEDVAAEIARNGGRAHAMAVDVADPDQVRAMVETAVETFGGLHAAVNNAGIGGAQAPIADYPLESWARVIDVNLNGIFYGLRYQIAAMLASGGGSIVNMSSILGTVGFDNSCAYVAAKHAIQGLTRNVALEYGARGIRANAVGPAFIDTPLLTRNLDDATLGALAGLHPVGRIGTVEEVSALTCFLLSDRASFITGSYHLVDGGYTAR